MKKLALAVTAVAALSGQALAADMAVKAAMNLAGFRGGIPRRPLLPLSEAQVENLRTLFVKEGLIS